jgi:nitrogen fixation negative regulator NifL
LHYPGKTFHALFPRRKKFSLIRRFPEHPMNEPTHPQRTTIEQLSDSLLVQTVRNQKVLIESVIDALPMATVLLDEEGRVVLDNNAYKSLVSDLNVKEPVRLFLERLEADLGGEWLRLCEARQPFRDKEVCFERGGSRPARWYSCAGAWFPHPSPLPKGEGEQGCRDFHVDGDDSVDAFSQCRSQTYLLLVLSDISRLKRQQEEIRLSAIKSLTAEEEKTSSLREALSAAIHQMQGPMNMLGAVMGVLERRGDPANAGLLDLLGQVLAQGEQSVSTLQACLPQGDGQAFAPVNLNRILRDALELETERLLAAGIVVDWQPFPLLLRVAGAENRLRSLFKQLLDNAIEAMSRAGVKRRELRVGTAAEGDVLRVWIEDSGPGIAPDLRVKVFEPFFTTKSGGRRAGMGLTLAQDVVNQHGGMIRVDPGYGQGCRMELQFFVQREAPANEAAHG